MYPTLLYVLTLVATMALPASTQSRTFLTSKRNKLKSCITKTNQTGVCVFKTYCNDAHEVLPGGNIFENELRSGEDCNKNANEWCCTRENVTQTIVLPTATISPIAPAIATSYPIIPTTTTTSPIVPTTATTPPIISTTTTTSPIVTIPAIISTKTEKNCIASEQPDCPWCVKLYRGKMFPSQLYCMGSMIAPNVILTTATCVIQAKGFQIGASVPNSANPDVKLLVTSRVQHTQYNSGTRLNDIALLRTLNDVEWSPGSTKFACLDPEQSLNGKCTGAGVNEKENIDMLTIYVTRGSCFSGGNVSDAMCGNWVSLDMLMHGSPIMCPKNNGYILTGLTKTSYPFDTSKALLGNLDYKWLTDTLTKEMGLTDKDFLYKLNYDST